MGSRKPVRLGRLALVASMGLELAAWAHAEGGFIGPHRGELLETGSTVEVRWSAPCPADANESEVLLSLDGGLTFPIRLTPEMAACTKGFRWEVPALASTHARLALRGGSGEASEGERLYLVSEEFTILDGEADDAEDLVSGARELWTRQALEGVGIEELPAPSLADGQQHLVLLDPAQDIGAPRPPHVFARPPDASVLKNGGAPPVPSVLRQGSPGLAPIVPLRL